MLLVVNIPCRELANTLNAPGRVQPCAVLHGYVTGCCRCPRQGYCTPVPLTPYVAILLIGIDIVGLHRIFTDEQLTKLVSFNNQLLYDRMNLAVIWFFFVKEQRRGSMDLVNFSTGNLPLAGTLILLYVWSGFDHLTQILGFSWLAVGIVFGYIKSGLQGKFPMPSEEKA